MKIYDFIRKYLLVFLCISLSLYTLLGSFFNIKEVDEIENRKLASLPTFSIDNIKTYFNDLSLYVDDHFGGRNLFLSLDRKISSLKDNESSEKAIMGKNDFAYYISSLKLYEKEKTNDEKFNLFKNKVKYLSEYFPDKPIFVFIYPNKTQAYPEYLPNGYKKSTLRDDIVANVESLNGSKNIYVKDLKDDILNAKKDYDKSLYYTNDTHWNAYGAYVAYKNSIDFINKNSDFNLIIKQDIKQINETVNTKGDLARMLNKVGEFTDTNYEFIFEESSARKVEKKIQDTKEYQNIGKVDDYINPKINTRAVIMHDSFYGAGLKNFLSESFGELNSYWGLDQTNESLLKKVKEINPDIIIIGIVDRHLMK